MMGQGQGSDEVVIALINPLDVLLRSVAAIKDQGNQVALIGKLAIAVDQGFGKVAEHSGVVLIAGVEMGEQGDLEVGADHQGQADNTQIGPLALGVTPLSEVGRGLRIDEGIEIGGVQEQGSQIDFEVFNQALGQSLLDFSDGGTIQIAHMVPEPLTGQGTLGDGQKALQKGFTVPAVEGGLTGGFHTAVQRGQEQVLAASQALLALGNKMVNDINQVDLLSDIPQGGQGAELKDLGLDWLAGVLFQAFQEGIGGTQMEQDDGPGFTVDPSGFDDLPVGMASGDFFLDGSHFNQCIHMAASCQEKNIKPIIYV